MGIFDNLSPKDAEFVGQFLFDASVGKGIGNEMTEDIANEIKAVCHAFDQYEDWNTSMIVVSGELGAGGGHFHLYEITKLGERSTGVEHRTTGDFSSDIAIMIEPESYGHVEPYNRQHPYYIGCSYDRMDKQEAESFNVFTEKLPARYCNLWTSFDEFYWNSYWHSVRFGSVMPRRHLVSFFSRLIMTMGPEWAEVRSAIVDYINYYTKGAVCNEEVPLQARAV